MPSALTYPGVYIEEIPSGVRTIIGVGTSIAAFVGRAEFGPVNEPIVINGYADFERRFGGLWRGSKLGYAVRDFFLNGGSQAIIVRLFSPSSDEITSPAHQAAIDQAKTAATAVADAAAAKAAEQNATKESVLTGIAVAVVQAGAAGAAAAAAAKIVAEKAAQAGSKVGNLDATPANILLAVELAVKTVGQGNDAADGAQAVVAETKTAKEKPDATVLSVLAAATEAALTITGSSAKIKAADLVAKAAVDASKGTMPVTAQSTVQTMNKAAKEAVVAAAEAAANEVAPHDRSKSIISVGDLNLVAADEGLWGKKLRATVDFMVSKAAADSMGLKVGELFNLTVRDLGSGEVEQFRNVTGVKSARRVDGILRSESILVRCDSNLNAPAPEFKVVRKAWDDLLAAENATPRDEQAIEKARKDYEKAQNDPATNAEKDLADAVRKKDNAQIIAAQAELDKVLRDFGGSDGQPLKAEDFIGDGKQGAKKGLYALADADLFNILCIPPYLADKDDVEDTLITEAAQYCERRRAMLLVDPRSDWNSKEKAKAGVPNIGTNSKNAALFFPRLLQADPLLDGQVADFVPCGAVAGIFARTDATRGVWKAPAGFEATLVGVPQLKVPLTDGENGELNPLGINCLRTMPAAGRIVWGSRTLQGDDRLASEWKYIPVRRTALFIEESLYRGTQWVVFEPNDEPLWAQIRLNVGAFMNDLFRQGAFQGQTPRDAYFVKCSSETTTQNDINKGIVNILVGFAPLKPAEFVVVKLQQIAGQIQT